MTGSSPPSPPAPLGLSKLARLERAATAMERGHGVILRTETAAALVLGAELATPAHLAALRQLGAVHLFLTPQRAKILRLRLYTEGAIALGVGADWEAGFIRGLADPAADMGFAFRGPLQAERGPLPPLAGASLKLAHLAGLLPAALMVTLKPDAAAALALETGFDLLDAALLDASTWDDVWAGAPHEMEPVANARLPIADNENCRLMAFRPRPREAFGPSGGGTHHYALLVGKVDAHKPVLVRLHSECFTGDLLGSLKCDCGDQLRGAIRCMAAEGSGVVLYLRQEGRGIGLLNKLRAYRLQDQGFDTVDANERLGFPDDLRSFAPAAAMMRALDIRQVRLLTNNPRKVEGLKAEGIDVIERVAHDFPANPHNAHYLATKAKRSGHFL